MAGNATTELIGRRAALEAIAQFVESIPAGASGLVIEGEPGIGKSVLLAEAVADAGARGYHVLSSHPARADAALSFSGLEDLLRDSVDEVLSMLPEPQRRALETVLLLRDPEGEPPGALAVAVAVRGALAGIARSGPTVIAIDDAQWLDEPTAAAVGHAIRRLGQAPVALVAAWQTGEDADSPLVGLPSEFRRLPVGPMPAADLRKLLRARLGLSLSAGRLERLSVTCAGNPMAALEVGRAMLEAGDGDASWPAIPVPDVLADLLRRRVSMLTKEGRHALLVVSCVSEPTAALVETVAGEGGAEGLAEAFREGLLREDGGLLRLRQALVGSVLYADADAGTRRGLHRRIAEVIEDPLDRAMHLALSVEGWDEAVAAEVEAAARATRRRGAPSAAADLCDQARRLTPPHMAEDATRRALLAAEYSLDAGELPRSRALLEGILESPGSGPARAAALQRLGWVRSHQDSWGSASELFREAASEAEQAPALLATVELDRAVASLVGGNLPAAAAHAGAALERSKEVGDAALVAGSSAMVASVGFLLGRGIDEEVLQRAVAAETWSRPRPTAARPSVAFGVLLKWSDQLDQSRELLERGLGLAEEHGAERSLPFILFHLSEVDCWLGDFPAAERTARRAIDVAEATGQDAGRAFGLSGLAAVQAALGREQEARAAATEGLALASSSGAVPAAVTCESTLGFLELSLGRPDRALRHLGPLVEGVVSGGVHEPGAMRYLGDALEALVSVGDLDTAEGVIEDLEHRSDELDRAWGSMVAARCRALLLAARGDLPGATASAEAAVGFQERLSQPFELARTLLVQGAIERRDRRKRAGRELLERALETFSELGADLWVGRVREELARIGGRAASSVSLTPTEVRIARLVVDGAKNNEVAASMFLSIRTVEWNLSRIYRKLGIRSRTELARWIGPGPASSR